ncbi:GMC family oxidoreductase [Salibaculum griseiflavum]|uniref:Glucose-methanol-choline oxidoreductase N-terminal domain-containing protein n=1 Tax=Salibaculum griseiflavum TaxID=1914409 RepID=A0A2V1P2M5_9RHOB|nr:GMC family oxidoreductase N-terminal domain-containing protein [Salibaculum griseiflavum]PWG16675.1 hypothetical protein DFK10_10125 [Salibaculum griseiflavum]
MTQEFDHIIVGAGSAGCAVAARLAELTTDRICVIEAGPSDADLRVKMPFGLVNLLGGPRDWARKTVPQENLGGRQVSVPRGKMLGGSGSINSMAWFRGRSDDFDGWETPGWGWSDVAPAFEAVEGALQPRRLANPHPLAEGFGRAFGGNDPQSAPTPERQSAGVCHANLHDGRRWSAADAFLRPAQKTGRVEVITGAEVDKVVMDGDRAAGVLLRDGRKIAANAGVILSAGSIETPMILMRSGLGPAAHLSERGIDPVRDIPGIGANLHDHPGVGLHFAGSGSGYGLTLSQMPRWALAPFAWAFARRGVFASPTVEACAFFRAMPGEGRPDAQCHFIPFMLGWKGKAITWGAGYFADVVVSRPRSRGSLTLGADRFTPAIDLNLLSDPYDLQVLMNGIPRLRQILKDAPLDPHRAPEGHPGELVTGDALETFIRKGCGTAYHPVGTVAMGENGPLAADLSLKGVTGLTVADASVMPKVTSANTNAPSMMIGWRAGGFVADRARAAKEAA